MSSKWTVKLRTEHFFMGFLLLFWGKDILFSYVRAVMLRLPYIRLTADYVFPVLMLVCVIFSMPYLLKAVSYKDFLFAAAVLLLYILQIILHPENGEYLWPLMGEFLTKVFPLYFIGLRFDPQRHLKVLYRLSLVNIWMFGIYTLFIGGAMSETQAAYSGSMHRAYVILPQVLVTMGYVLRKPTVFNGITGTMGVIFLVMCGNRGSVVLLAVFLLVYLFFLLEKKLRWGVYVGIAALSGAFVYYYELLLGGLKLLFERLGMSARIVEYLVSGEFFRSGSRNVITQKLLKAISRRPFAGYGMAADRRIAGAYAHNLALEWGVSFGVAVGAALLLAVVCIVVLGWRRAKSVEGRTFLLVLGCVGFLKLFISSSYLMEGMFFMLLGLCVGQMRQGKGSKGVRKEVQTG